MSQATSVPKSAFWIIFFVVFIDLLGFGIVFPFLPQYARLFEVSEWQIGLVLGSYSLMQFLFAPILGRWSDRVGRRPVLLVSMLGTALSFFVLAWAKSFWLFLIARCIDGIAGSNVATAQAYIADLSEPEKRTKHIGMWIGAAFGLGFAFGPGLGGLFQLFGDQVAPGFGVGFPFLAAGVLALLNWGFALVRLPESIGLRQGTHKLGSRTASLPVLKNKLAGQMGILMLSYALVILAFAQMEGTFTWLAVDHAHLSVLMVYGVFTYLGLVLAFVQGGLVRRLSGKVSDHGLASSGCAIMAVGLMILPFSTQLWVLLVGAGLLAFGHGFCHTALISSISKEADDTQQGETMGVTQSLASLSRFLGPLSAAWLYQTQGVVTAYWTAAMVMVLALVLLHPGFKNAVKPVN
ncbi:MAG: MFS transporter [Cyanobacteria bacterium HKST-UBA06]|nr:MFS transporter [Cyanobacteria bacterium HKST-UBA04]MCA9806373.1 MFS transporter [Cyanobacteria bacterium HKST-UBA06]MCA9842079.1 MFS transporter [Cyanobacteria bacterium HKST-UBA03]